MNEIPTIPWGRVLSNFVWILGAAIVFASFSYHEFLAHAHKTKIIEVFKRDSFKKPLHLGLILLVTGISASSFFYIFSKTPEVLFLKDIVYFPPATLEGRKLITDDSIMMPWKATIRSKKIQFEKSKYEIRIIAKGSKAFEETARLKVYVGINLIADFFTSSEYEEKIIGFKCEKKELRRLNIEFANDDHDPVTQEDRNIWIKSIHIRKINNSGK